jgi:hypothetical protein
LIRRLPCASPASLTRPLPIKMQLPSIWGIGKAPW